ncbi:MAG: hypothetical protein A3C43_00950 [Candidatus Schekmanbacteria bacterium RIFCSPHIGHO2_02_FULL_38_11]|uniref:asparagine synthase (glutamine-hydrolyzing) n=1 Tax=Candidatus Schekmanbacteria bacterium RIFCSPLOWO2_12_FULL_38_15 TaxID=1817883 RepID=A0A1F7SN03_9BACT|nr:MAG: hypothetical protein A2043_07995 [Candidatus Schekmanbacteria bacterium GWA2_38_9]OGL50040.1 MAG: hypothetical protein A3C43_00950 [Candidatus Schekmanbacteria bacterium RIFCSPHIGHO2_02_FULL_38_11]OGL51155.1 MAG: hypothetical protein A3H37_09025 [Candidatus Schekmanbacteria bacterium RIFCSPLOWO2_02_FULL_38_14]OGL55155.1 MAG: hypothetical protein A3G31_02850 [Candidatus Schekmanbacteria bacterium RIFCSPLOWO2_12_FULL_38_15]
MNFAGAIFNRKLSENIDHYISQMCKAQATISSSGVNFFSYGEAALGYGGLKDKDKGNADITDSAAVVFDGKVLNRLELLNILRKNGYEIKEDCSDAELLLSLYAEYQENCLEYIEGVFAFAVWDKHKKRLFAARDRLGEKPLFYYQDQNGKFFLLASSVKGILASEIIKKELNIEGIFHFLFMKAFEQPATPISGLYSLLPGYYLIYQDDTLFLKQYWDIKIKSNQNITEQAAMKEMKDLLENTVRRICSSIEPSSAGILLSGGIDSSYVAALLHQYYAEPIRTFHVTFGDEGKESNESSYAEIVSRHLNTVHTNVVFKANDIRNNLVNMVWNMNTPVSNSGFKLQLVSKLGHVEGIQHYFLGEGADTLFGLDERWTYFNVIERYLSFIKLLGVKNRRRIYEMSEAFSRYLKEEFKIRYLRGIHDYFFSSLGYFKWKGSVIREERIRRIFTNENMRDIRSIPDLYIQYFKNSGLKIISDKYTYIAFKTYMPNQQLMPYNSICKFYDAEPVFPYLDVQVLEFCVNLPNNLKSKDGIKKYILHSLASGSVPKEILKRPKMAFKIPFDVWLRSDLKPIVDYVFSEKGIAARDIFDKKELKRLYEDFYIFRTLSWVDIWSFVVLEIWLRIFYDLPKVEKPEMDLANLFNQ